MGHAAPSQFAFHLLFVSTQFNRLQALWGQGLPSCQQRFVYHVYFLAKPTDLLPSCHTQVGERWTPEQ